MRQEDAERVDPAGFDYWEDSIWVKVKVEVEPVLVSSVFYWTPEEGLLDVPLTPDMLDPHTLRTIKEQTKERLWHGDHDLCQNLCLSTEVIGAEYVEHDGEVELPVEKWKEQGAI